MIRNGSIEAPVRPVIATRALEALTIVEAADMLGLPMPFSIDVTNYLPLQVMVGTVDELNTWAERLDAEVDSHPSGLNVHHSATGELVGIAVRVACVVRS